MRLSASMWVHLFFVLPLGCAAEAGGDTDTDAGSSGDATDALSGTSGSGPGATTASASSAATQTTDTVTTGPTGPTDGEATQTDGDAQTEDSSGGGEDVGSAGCGSAALEPGLHAGLTLEHDGAERQFDLLIPESYDPDAPTSLVFNFHGLLSNPGQQAGFSQMNEYAETAGAIVVYPAGQGSSWNGGTCCGDAKNTEVDDVGFARALVEHVSTMLCVSPKRVFATGMSNGAFMSQRLGCEAGDVFAAIGPVAGVLGVPEESCAGRAVPVLHFHGTADLLVPYGGGGATGSPSVEESIAFWVEHNGCTVGPDESFAAGNVRCETWSGCTDDADVSLCTIENGGHCWPGNLLCPTGFSTTDIHASEAVLDFFAAHPLP